MKTTHKNLLTGSLTGIILLLLIASGSAKIIGSAGALQLASQIGIDPGTYRLLGTLEIADAVLFTLPRTGVLGTLLLSAYFGGAIAILLQHHDVHLFLPAGIEAFLWIVTRYRFPELTLRIKTGQFLNGVQSQNHQDNKAEGLVIN